MTDMTNSATSLKGTSRAFERPRYFPRQLITPDDMNLAQDYVRNRMRRHNRLLHGWGVVCGAIVQPGKDPWTVVIAPGFVLGPYGDEISIDQPVTFDVRLRCKPVQDSGGCPPSADPWCNEVADPAPTEGQALFVAVRYAEFPARPVRSSGCGCGGDECEYSRWRDGYEICVLDECPPSHVRADGQGEGGSRSNKPPVCECPTDPWVVLARVTAGRDGSLTVDTCACRRHVVSHAGEWWPCQDTQDG